MVHRRAQRVRTFWAWGLWTPVFRQVGTPPAHLCFARGDEKHFLRELVLEMCQMSGARPFHCALHHPFLVDGAELRRPRGARRLASSREASFATLCVLRRSRFIEQLGRSAFGDRALGLFRMYEDVRGAPLDRAVTHDRAPRPWHHLRSAPRSAQNTRRPKWTCGRMARAARSHRCGGGSPIDRTRRSAICRVALETQRGCHATASPEIAATLRQQSVGGWSDTVARGGRTGRTYVLNKLLRNVAVSGGGRGGIFAKNWWSFCEAIICAFYVHLQCIYAALSAHFCLPRPNAPDAEGDPCRSWLSPGYCISIPISHALLCIY